MKKICFLVFFLMSSLLYCQISDSIAAQREYIKYQIKQEEKAEQKQDSIANLKSSGKNPLTDFELRLDTICGEIDLLKDPFTGKVTRETPLLAPVHFSKSKGVIYIRLMCDGNTLEVGEKGVIILLEKGVKINKPQVEITVDYNSYHSSYEYSAFFQLTAEDIKKLLSYKIKGFRLFIYDYFIDYDDDKTIYQEYLRCLTKK